MGIVTINLGNLVDAEAYCRNEYGYKVNEEFANSPQFRVLVDESGRCLTRLGRCYQRHIEYGEPFLYAVNSDKGKAK